jgi:hypothetical protein
MGSNEENVTVVSSWMVPISLSDADTVFSVAELEDGGEGELDEASSGVCRASGSPGSEDSASSEEAPPKRPFNFPEQGESELVVFQRA